MLKRHVFSRIWTTNRINLSRIAGCHSSGFNPASLCPFFANRNEPISQIFPSCKSLSSASGLSFSRKCPLFLSFIRVHSRSYSSDTLAIDHKEDRLPGGIIVASDHTKIDHSCPSGESVKIATSSSNDVDRLFETITDASDPNHSDWEKSLEQFSAKLTTPLVIEVLHRFRYEEKIAFRFFTWAAQQENYSHEPHAYDDMIEILSSTKYKVRQFQIVCELLDYMKRKNKRYVPVEVLIPMLRQYTEKHLTHLHKFAKKKKIKMKTQPEIDALNLLLDCFCKCCLVENAEAMLAKVKNKIKPNADTYNILFFGWCRVRNPVRGMSILEKMIKMGFTPDNFTYITAIDTYCKAGMVAEASKLFEFMKTNGTTMSSPTAKTYATMIVSLVQNDKMEESFKLLADMIGSGCLPDVSTYKEMIEGVCLAGKVEVAYKLLEEMGMKGYPPDVVTYNCFLKVLCDQKNSEEALKLYRKMWEGKCKPSVHSFNMLITMYFEMGDPDGAFETWHEMERRGCDRDTDTCCLMIEGLFACGNAKDACFLLEEVMNRGMKLPYQKFDSFLKKLSEIGDLQSIHRLSDYMRSFYNPVMARRFAMSQKRRSTSLRGR